MMLSAFLTRPTRFLGSDSHRIEKHNELESLYMAVESLPWGCIGPDQLEHLSHLVSGRYSWTSPLLYQSIKSLPRDPRCCVLRLFKVVCGLPLTGEERGRAEVQVSVMLRFYILTSESLRAFRLIKRSSCQIK